MAETGARNDPYFAFRFEVVFDDITVGGFSECSGLQLETDVFDYNEGGLNTHVRKFVTRTKQTNLTRKRGIVDRVMWDWYYDLTRGDIRFRNGSVVVRDPSGDNVVMEWQFRDAFPCKWMGPELNATQNSVAIETLEICHQGLERIQ
jgi:phage tail-like protein